MKDILTGICVSILVAFVIASGVVTLAHLIQDSAVAPITPNDNQSFAPSNMFYSTTSDTNKYRIDLVYENENCLLIEIKGYECIHIDSTLKEILICR